MLKNKQLLHDSNLYKNHINIINKDNILYFIIEFNSKYRTAVEYYMSNILICSYYYRFWRIFNSITKKLKA